MTSPITVLIVDDHPVVVEGMRIVVEGTATGAVALSVVGSASTSSQAVLEARRLRPDVVLLDVRLDDSDPETAVLSIRNAVPDTAVVLFTADIANPRIPALLRAGAVGALSKDIAPQHLRESVIAAARGNPILASSHAIPRGDRVLTPLTPRELEVLHHVALGKTNAEIADDLGLTPSTVKTYWQSTMQKLTVRNRTEAVGVGHRLGLLELPR